MDAEDTQQTPSASSQTRWWRTASILLAILAASGPITALVNGILDRDLQEQRNRNEIAIKQLEIFLTRTDTPRDREPFLRSVVAILSADAPSDVLLELASDELEAIETERTGRVKEAANARDLARKNQEIEQLEVQLGEVSAQLVQRELNPASQSLADLATEVERLQTELRQARREREAATAARNKALQSLDRSGSEASPFGFWVPGDDLKLIEAYSRLCREFGRAPRIVYSSPELPAVACIVRRQDVTFDHESIEVININLRRDRVLQSPNDPRQQIAFAVGAASRSCDDLDGELIVDRVQAERFYSDSLRGLCVPRAQSARIVVVQW